MPTPMHELCKTAQGAPKNRFSYRVDKKKQWQPLATIAPILSNNTLVDNRESGIRHQNLRNTDTLSCLIILKQRCHDTRKGER